MLIVIVVVEEVVEVVVVVVVIVVVSLLLFQTTKNSCGELLQIAINKERKTNIFSLLSWCVDAAKAHTIPMRNIDSTPQPLTLEEMWTPTAKTSASSLLASNKSDLSEDNGASDC